MDLFYLLKVFSARIRSPSFSIGEFLDYVGKFAAKKAVQEPEWKQWEDNAEGKFNAEILALTESGKCIVLASSKGGRIFVPAACRDLIAGAYKDIDALADSPFLNEQTLKLRMPGGFARTVLLNSDMGPFFDDQKGDGVDPGEIINLQFPHNCGNALMLASMLPRRLMEMALLKIRSYLHTRNNRDFVLNKLIGQLPGREKMLKDIVERVMIRPLDCVNEMERSADFPYLFWSYFCPLVKNDISKKNEILNDDVAALQAVCVVEICSGYYRARAAKKREVDAAFMNLEARLDKKPWRFTLDEIVGFKNDKGISLVDIYSPRKLEEYIQEAITESRDGLLPRWLVIQGATKGERWFVKKDRYVPVCIKMLQEAQQRVKAEISNNWSRLLKDYSKEPSMEKDADFEKCLEKQTKAVFPDLPAMLADPKLFLTYEEINRGQGTAHQLFRDGKLLPYSVLYGLDRRLLLSDVKLKLPFWYSVPILVAIIGFFKRLRARKRAARWEDADDEIPGTKKEGTEFQKSVTQIESSLVPPGKTLDGYLDELEERWVHLLDPDARENLVNDVHVLLRDNLRNTMRVYKLKRVSRDGLREIVEMMISRNAALRTLKEQKALQLYMELYMIKLLSTKRI